MKEERGGEGSGGEGKEEGKGRRRGREGGGEGKEEGKGMKRRMNEH